MKNISHLPDAELWEDVKRSIRPLGRKSAGASRPSARPLHRPPQRAAGPDATPAIHMRKGHIPPLGQFERKLLQRLSRGQIEPDATIDLHGETLESARYRLLSFVKGAQAAGSRLVLVITGKGREPRGLAPGAGGLMRREVPFWLEESAFRAGVLAFHVAHPRHGGGGALYLRLRRAERGT